MEASVRVSNLNVQWKWSSACGMRWDLFWQRTINRSHFRMRFEYELLCWDLKDGELWVHREQGCETQTKNLKKVSDQFFFFQYLYIFKRITVTKIISTCNHSHWTCPRWHQIYKPFNKLHYQKTVIHFNKYTFGLKLDTEVNHEIVTRNFWYKSISVQSTIKQTTTKTYRNTTIGRL